jgi:hypothetical protein
VGVRGLVMGQASVGGHAMGIAGMVGSERGESNHWAVPASVAVGLSDGVRARNQTRMDDEVVLDAGDGLPCVVLALTLSVPPWLLR